MKKIINLEMNLSDLLSGKDGGGLLPIGYKFLKQRVVVNQLKIPKLVITLLVDPMNSQAECRIRAFKTNTVIQDLDIIGMEYLDSVILPNNELHIFIGAR